MTGNDQYNFSGKKILVIGDVMLDRYLNGRVERISPEAPVPVVMEENILEMPGGAGNVARNITSLGAQAVLIGVLGRDSAGEKLMTCLIREGIDCSGLICCPSRVTTQKTRVVSGNQQLLRIDREEAVQVESHVLNNITGFVEQIKDSVDGVILSDYDKGVITRELIEFINSVFPVERYPVIVDPKPRNVDFIRNISVLKPNLRELEQIASVKYKEARDVESFCRSLMARQEYGAVLVTLGKEGMLLVEKDGLVTSIPGKKCEVYDVSGAGDTVTAVLALCLCSGRSLQEAAFIANTAASMVVSRPGTAVLRAEELFSVLS